MQWLTINIIVADILAMTFKMKLFAILWLAGMVGVLSILLIDLSAVIASLPVRAGTKIPPITPALKLLTLVQPGILLILAVLLARCRAGS